MQGICTKGSKTKLWTAPSVYASREVWGEGGGRSLFRSPPRLWFDGHAQAEDTKKACTSRYDEESTLKDRKSSF